METTVTKPKRYDEKQIIAAMKEHRNPKQAAAALGMNPAYFQQRWAKIRDRFINNALDFS